MFLCLYANDHRERQDTRTTACTFSMSMYHKLRRLEQLSFSATGTEGLLTSRAHQLSGSNPYLYLPSGLEICYLHICHQSHATIHLSFRPTSNPELAINFRSGGPLGHVRSGMHLLRETDLRPSLTNLKTPYVANMGTVIPRRTVSPIVDPVCSLTDNHAKRDECHHQMAWFRSSTIKGRAALLPRCNCPYCQPTK